jgi:hypothetical protein
LSEIQNSKVQARLRKPRHGKLSTTAPWCSRIVRKVRCTSTDTAGNSPRTAETSR